MVKHLPYFHVWFDPNNGYGHVIEDGANWQEWFGREVLASPMDLSPDLWRRTKPVTDNTARLADFQKKWDPYNWTKMLDE